MKVLNLYAGLGGNRKLWTGCEVTAVENNEEIAQQYSKNFPLDKVVVADAHQYLLDHLREFDFIWSSTPCQSHSKLNSIAFYKNKARRYPDMALYQEIIFLQTYFRDRLFVVENVDPYYEPMLPARKLHRHLFWSNFRISNFEVPASEKYFVDMTTAELSAWLGMSCGLVKGKRRGQLLRNCVHPELGLHIFNCATRGLEYTEQGTLFEFKEPEK